MRTLTGLADIAPDFDGYIVDLWGVIHDGVTPYPGALACLAELRARGKRIVLLSNAPRRAAAVMDGLRQLGIEERLYDGIVTSGEATHAALRARPDDWFRALGYRVFHLGPPRDRNVFADLGLTQATDPADATFVLNTGPDDERSPTDPAAFDDLLDRCRAAGLPMLCANPDLVVIRDGQAILCAGALAQRYTLRGGDVRLIGKPDPAIYPGVMTRLGTSPARTLAIGDSLRTDIAGAAGVGLTALWILGGIHVHQTQAEAARQGLHPQYTSPRLVW